MSENWDAVAADVAAAIRSISQDGEGFPATLRRAGTTAPINPWDPPGGAPTYVTLRVVDDEYLQRDATGVVIGETRRTLTAEAVPDVVPTEADLVAVGVAAEQASEASAWVGIVAVRRIAPAGVAVLYEIDLAS